MILYHGTTKEAAKNIKKNGFSWNLIGSNWGSTYGNAIYFTNNYDNAKNYSKNNDKEGEILKVEIENINFLKLTKVCFSKNFFVLLVTSIIAYNSQSNTSCKDLAKPNVIKSVSIHKIILGLFLVIVYVFRDYDIL